MKSGEAKNDDQEDVKGKGLTTGNETQPSNVKMGSGNKRDDNKQRQWQGGGCWQ